MSQHNYPRVQGLKRGAALQFYARYDIDGTPLVFPASELKAQVRTATGVLVSELSIAETETPGTFLLSDLTTSDWPIGDLLCDLKRTSGGVVMATQTFVIPVLKPQTV